MTDTDLTTAKVQPETVSRRNLATPAMVLAIWWLLLWLTTWAGSQGWLPIPQLIVNFLLLVDLLLGLGLLLWSVTIIIVRLLQRKLTLNHVLPLAIVLVGVLLAGRIPSKPAVIFSRHRQEFIEINQAALKRFAETGESNFPETDLFESAVIYNNLAARNDPSSVVVEYMAPEFYLPIVYVATDRPEEIYDTCSSGGAVIEQMEPNWYVCRRDWN